MRLSYVLVFSGLCNSPFQARQLISNGSVLVNSKKVISSSLIVIPGDLISIKPSSAGIAINGGQYVSFSQEYSQWRETFIAFSQTKAVSIIILR